MPRCWEYHWEFWEEMLGHPPASKPEPVPESALLPPPAPPRREVPKDARSLKGLDQMKSLFAMAGKHHYRNRY
jgi:hypothetical protein